MQSRPTIIALIVCAVSALPAGSQQSTAGNLTAPARAEVLVLGTYHMANPGRDIVNMQVDDVLAPKRQAEIAEVMAVLQKFRPTKIAVEGSFNDDAMAPSLFVGSFPRARIYGPERIEDRIRLLWR